MFGVLKHSSCSLSASDKQAWMGYICGTCVSLSKISGFPARIATNYDAALLSVLHDALVPDIQAKRISCCPLRPTVKTEIIAENNPGVLYGASMALLAASTKIKDHIQDNDRNLRHLKGIASRVANRWEQIGLETSAALGVNVANIVRQVRHQITVEAHLQQDFLYYARPTELAVGTAFGNLAILANHPQITGQMQEMGQMFGRIMYLLDSYQDYAADLAANKFNALANAYSAEELDDKVRHTFQHAYQLLALRFEQLELQNSTLLSALLLKGLQRQGYQTLQICKNIPTGGKPLSLRSFDDGSSERPLGVRQFKSQREKAHDQNGRNDGCFDCWCCCDCFCCIDCCDCCECHECCGDGCDCCCIDGDCCC